MRIYTSETVIEVTNEEIKTINNLIAFVEDEKFEHEDVYYLLKAILETKDKDNGRFCDSWDRFYTIKRVEK